MNDKTILKLKSNWDKIKIIATITFIILAGTVYSVSTMIKGGKADDRIELVVTDSVISTSDGAGYILIHQMILQRMTVILIYMCIYAELLLIREYTRCLPGQEYTRHWN